ncbi:MAG: M50 family metallopeptidase [Cellulosilyticaceae bacterium]
MLPVILMMIVMFAIIVLVHEWGHYIAAKKLGVRVNEFAIGMGPKLWSKQKGETLYSIRAFPIGGFCSMEGEAGDVTGPQSMMSKKPWERFVIFAAGAFMNFILAWVLLTIFVGYQGYGTNKVDQVSPNMPAMTAGLLAGDEIITIDGHKVKDIDDIHAITGDPKKTYIFEVKRVDGKVEKLEIKPQIVEDGSGKFGFIPAKGRSNVVRLIKEGFVQTFEVVGQVIDGFVQLVTRKVDVDEMAGIIGVTQISSQAWNQAIEYGLDVAIMQMIFIAALLSANLAVLNLLPLPALDGGRIVFTLIEMVRRKPIDPEKEGMVHFIGFVLLMALMVVVFYNDIMRMVR